MFPKRNRHPYPKATCKFHEVLFDSVDVTLVCEDDLLLQWRIRWFWQKKTHTLFERVGCSGHQKSESALLQSTDWPVITWAVRFRERNSSQIGSENPPYGVQLFGQKNTVWGAPTDLHFGQKKLCHSRRSPNFRHRVSPKSKWQNWKKLAVLGTCSCQLTECSHFFYLVR